MNPAIITGVLSLIALAFPAAAPVIAVIAAATPYLIAAEPIIVAAIKEGVPAFQAAEAAAPQLTAAIKQLAAHLPTPAGTTEEAHHENVARLMFGFPRMTQEEEMAWMDRFTPPSLNDSRVGSG